MTMTVVLETIEDIVQQIIQLPFIPSGIRNLESVQILQSWSYKDDSETIQRLLIRNNEEESNTINILAPTSSFLLNYILPRILFVSIIIFIIHYINYNFVLPKILLQQKQQQQQQQQNNNIRHVESYRFTNLVVNFVLGIFGLYTYFYVLPKNNPPVEERMISYSNTEETPSILFWLPIIQLGYQCWAIPVGKVLVKESPIMLCHHLGVISEAILSSCFINGYLYFTPFMFGILELTSVPLAIMNFIQNNPSVSKQLPSYLPLVVRGIFAFSFLFVRIIWMTPIEIDWLRLCYLTILSIDETTFMASFYKYYLYCCFYMSWFLFILQFYWASLITSGIVKVVAGIIMPKKTTTKKKKLLKEQLSLSVVSLTTSATSIKQRRRDINSDIIDDDEHVNNGTTMTTYKNKDKKL